MTSSDITALFDRMATLHVGVIGDFALDLYYSLNTETGERSIETGQVVFWGSRPRSSLGAAGNVVQNLTALGIRNISVVGCIGDDLYGREMRSLFEHQGVRTQHLVAVTDGWDTCVYTKPMGGNRELNRVDFGTHNQLPDTLFADLLRRLEQALPGLDVLIINQQFPNPLLTEDRVLRLNDLIGRYAQLRVVADMRQVGRQIRGAILKVNTAELARFLGVPLPGLPDLDWCVQHGNLLSRQLQGPLLITRGEHGIVFLDGRDVYRIDGLPLTGEVDTVGAGDTVVAAFAAGIGAGAAPAQALEIANLAAAVTVRKLHQTGTATPAEIMALQRTYSV
ncbi:carbohydrate kinase [Fibrisoma montanum]|uniref:Carbohydrate kinase n=1 Tax=Fibrisoma montanum TaxID=2305895 RepID=A0A418LXG2_9BACT|nr:PfkB family carbohydrate kinase [Fibrisoma montanum]RIV17939.1 carbohydrate kinase [Fibrisoma montanum]